VCFLDGTICPPTHLSSPQLDAAAADAAIQALHESELQGRPLKVTEAAERGTAPPRGPRPEVFIRPGFQRLYVGNLNFRTTAADLGKHFQQYGAVQVSESDMMT